MEFKGITWAGNIYQKFEAMCLEVEEAMYQDTVKYVENQVQKVGFSVKKFCSVVTEDLLPPACVYPVNLSSGDLSLNFFDDTDVVKKPIPSIVDIHHDLKKKENEDQVHSNATAEKESSLSGCYDINSLCPQSQDKCSESHASISKKVGVQRRPVGIKRISKNNHPSKDSCRTPLISGDRSKPASSSSVASDDTNSISTLDLDVRGECGHAIKGNTPIPEAPMESPASAKILLAESVRQNEDAQDCTLPASGKPLSAEPVRQNKDNIDSNPPAFENNLLAEPERLKGDSGSTSSCSGLPSESTGIYSGSTSSRTGLPTESTGTSVNAVSFSMSRSHIRSKTCNLESEGEVVMVSNEGTSMKDDSSIVSNTLCFVESYDKEIIKSNEDAFDMLIIEDYEAAVPRLEYAEREKLDESCVMVEGDKLHSLPQGTKKNKSYKKKIREAFSPKLRSRKDNQSVLTVDSMIQKAPARDSFESDWELL